MSNAVENAFGKIFVLILIAALIQAFWVAGNMLTVFFLVIALIIYLVSLVKGSGAF